MLADRHGTDTDNAAFARLKSIPEMLGSAPVPETRRDKYSVNSYRAQYMLLEHQARRFHNESRTHQEVVQRVYQLLAKDSAYKQRLIDGYPPVPKVADQGEVDELMQQLHKTSWASVGKEL